MRVSAKYTIAGAQYENIKIKIEGETVSELGKALSEVVSLEEQFMATYDRLIEYRDTRDRAISHTANRLIVDELGAEIISVTTLERAPEPGTETPESSTQPVKFWEREAPSSPAAGTAQAVKPSGKISLL